MPLHPEDARALAIRSVADAGGLSGQAWVGEFHFKQGGADEFGLPAALEDGRPQVEGALHPNLPGDVPQLQCASGPVVASEQQ